MSEKTLWSVLTKGSENYAQKKAVIVPKGVSVTYTELLDKVQRLREQMLSYGALEPQDSVAIVAPNGYPFVVTFFATVASRFKVAPLNQAYGVDEFVFYLKDTNTKAVLIVSEWAEHNARVAAKQENIPIWEIITDNTNISIKFPDEIEPKNFDNELNTPKEDDVALFLHTSGTTSKPKGVPLTHLNIFTSIDNIATWYKLSSADTTLVVMPLFHVHGLIGVTLSTFLSGGTTVIPSRFSATEFWQQVTENNVTWYSAVPTIHQILLIRSETEAPPDNFKFRFVRSCSSSLAPVTMQKLEALLKAPVLEAYGMTEASHQMASNPLPEQGERIPGTVGRGSNVEIGIFDDLGNQLEEHQIGEVCIRGKNVTAGYHNRPEANVESFLPNGWFRTGDQGVLENGYLRLTGRIKELINRGGEKISPVELDSVFLGHPLVASVVVFGVPDEKYGEEVHAAVILKENASCTVAELQSFCKSKVAEFKVPKVIHITDDFPRTATGKVQRRIVAQYFASKN